jgi:hypothetical protein
VRLPGMKPAEWAANIIALAALVSSAYAIYVTLNVAREQAAREERAKGMNYAIALRFDVQYRPALLKEGRPDRPDRPPYLVIPARVIFTNGSTLPQAFNNITFGFDGVSFYPVLAVRDQSGNPISWPLNIQPGTTTAFELQIPFPVSGVQADAIENRLKRRKAKIQSWQQFEDVILREIRVGPDTLLTSMPRKTYFWIETFSPSPGFPHKILFNQWVPNHWVAGRTD